VYLREPKARIELIPPPSGPSGDKTLVCRYIISLHPVSSGTTALDPTSEFGASKPSQQKLTLCLQPSATPLRIVVTADQQAGATKTHKNTYEDRDGPNAANKPDGRHYLACSTQPLRLLDAQRSEQGGKEASGETATAATWSSTRAMWSAQASISRQSGKSPSMRSFRLAGRMPIQRWRLRSCSRCSAPKDADSTLTRLRTFDPSDRQTRRRRMELP
jgi:hypothetical protein